MLGTLIATVCMRIMCVRLRRGTAGCMCAHRGDAEWVAGTAGYGWCRKDVAVPEVVGWTSATETDFRATISNTQFPAPTVATHQSCRSATFGTTMVFGTQP
jgi:hypothetical protein